MRHFFIDPDALAADTALLTGPEAKHLKTVLRATPGEEIALFDGTGMRYRAVIKGFSKEGVAVAIVASDRPPQPPVALHLGIGLLTGQKMELVIQKATELGVAAVHPFFSQHCTMRPKGDNRRSRWQRIALEACKQCGRPQLPAIAPPVEFTDLLAANTGSGCRIIFWEREGGRTLADLPAPPAAASAEVLALLGPEGGFSDEEVSRAEAAGFLPLSLGPRILRAETAALTAAAILQFLLGNLAPAAAGNGP